MGLFWAEQRKDTERVGGGGSKPSQPMRLVSHSALCLMVASSLLVATPNVAIAQSTTTSPKVCTCKDGETRLGPKQESKWVFPSGEAPEVKTSAGSDVGYYKIDGAENFLDEVKSKTKPLTPLMFLSAKGFVRGGYNKWIMYVGNKILKAGNSIAEKHKKRWVKVEITIKRKQVIAECQEEFVCKKGKWYSKGFKRTPKALQYKDLKPLVIKSNGPTKPGSHDFKTFVGKAKTRFTQMAAEIGRFKANPCGKLTRTKPSAAGKVACGPTAKDMNTIGSVGDPTKPTFGTAPIPGVPKGPLCPKDKEKLLEKFATAEENAFANFQRANRAKVILEVQYDQLKAKKGAEDAGVKALDAKVKAAEAEKQKRRAEWLKARAATKAARAIEEKKGCHKHAMLLPDLTPGQEYAFAFAYSIPERCVAITHYVGENVYSSTPTGEYQFDGPIAMIDRPEPISQDDPYIPECVTYTPPTKPESVSINVPEELIQEQPEEPGLTEVPEDKTTPPEQAETPKTTQTPEQPEPSTDKPEEPEETEQPEETDLGLVKAQEAVVILALAGDGEGDAISEAVIKLVDEAPNLPGEEEVASLELTSLDNYQEDVQGGFTNDEGEISLSLVDESGEAFEPSIRQDDEEGSTPAAGEDNPAVIRKTVPVNKEKYEHLVIAGTPQQTGEGEEQKDAAPFGQLSASLAPAQSRICVARSFSIGGTPIYSVKLPAKLVPIFKETVSESGYSFVEPDPCRIKEEANDPHYKSSGLWKQSFDNQWAMKRAGFGRDNESYWKTKAEQRRDVVVAVIDSGLDWYHPDFPKSSLWRNEGEIPGNNIDDDNNGYVDDVIGWNFIDNNKSPWDHDGHGTFVAGVIAAGQNNGIGISGIAPSAKIMVLKALDTFGQGHASMVAEAIAYATDNGAEIINLSLGGRGLTQIEQLAVDHARTRGALIVVAAGNAGKQVENFSPAGLNGVITVAASDRNDKRAGFSNWGRKIDISAPGADVLSLRARKTDLLSLIRGVKYEKGQGIVGEDRAYYRASGTSFAAPFVTATAAEIMARDATLDADDVRRMILNSAKDTATPGFDNYTGYGLLDGQAALSADPAYFLESRIDGIKIIKKGGKAFLRVSGTIDADQFKGARIQLGKGSAPKKWLQVNKLLDKVVKDGTLMDLPAGFFKGAKEWTIRIITEHGSGAKRESRFKLKLG